MRVWRHCVAGVELPWPDPNGILQGRLLCSGWGRFRVAFREAGGALARGIHSLLLPLALGIEAGWPKRREAVRGEAREPGLQGNAG